MEGKSNLCDVILFEERDSKNFIDLQFGRYKCVIFAATTRRVSRIICEVYSHCTICRRSLFPFSHKHARRSNEDKLLLDSWSCLQSVARLILKNT